MNSQRFTWMSACVLLALIAAPALSFPSEHTGKLTEKGNVTVTVNDPPDVGVINDREQPFNMYDVENQLQNERFKLFELQNQLQFLQPDLSFLPNAVETDLGQVLDDKVLLALDKMNAKLKQGDAREREAWDAYRKAYALVLDEKWNEAVAALDAVEKKYPSSTWADDAGFWKAYSRGKSSQPLEEVFAGYDQFLSSYPRSKWSDEARANMIRVGNKLALSGKPEYAEKIKPFKDSGETDIALTALVALRMTGEDTMPQIMKLYDSSRNPAVRERIVTSISGTSDPKATDFLIRIAESDTSSAMRERTVNMLGIRITSLIHVSGTYGIGNLLGQSSTGMRYLQQNGQSFQTTTPALPSTGIQSSQQSREISAEQKDKILSALGRIARKDPEENIRGQALFWIGRSDPGEEQITLLETVVKTDPSISVREKALFALSQVPENRGVPALISLAKSDVNLTIRKRAIQFLGMSKDPRAREALLEIVREAK